MPLDLDDNPADDRPLVVVGFDGSEAAARAIAVATTLIAGAEVLAVCVYRPLRDAAGAALLGASEELVRGGARALDAQRRQEAQQTAERGAALAAAGGCASEALALAAPGAVWAAIEHLAEHRRAAAVVVGERRLSGLGRIVLGSVSSGLVHHATLPVLVVPDTGEERSKRRGRPGARGRARPPRVMAVAASIVVPAVAAEKAWRRRLSGAAPGRVVSPDGRRSPASRATAGPSQ